MTTSNDKVIQLIEKYLSESLYTGKEVICIVEAVENDEVLCTLKDFGNTGYIPRVQLLRPDKGKEFVAKIKGILPDGTVLLDRRYLIRRKLIENFDKLKDTKFQAIVKKLVKDSKYRHVTFKQHKLSQIKGYVVYLPFDIQAYLPATLALKPHQRNDLIYVKLEKIDASKDIIVREVR